MADLHRLPHRLGDAAPGRIDQGARRRARDEDARQVEQQRRVLVAARIQPGQRHHQFAAAQVGIADQVEGGIGRDEAVLAVRAQQMRRAVADHAVDLRQCAGAAPASIGRRRLGMVERDGVERVGDRLADRRPVRLGIVAGADQRLAQRGPAASRRAVRAGRPGAAAPAARDCRARSCRIWPDAGRRRAWLSSTGSQTS